MNQYDRLTVGTATAAEIAGEIQAKMKSRPSYRKLPGHVMVEEFLAPHNLELRDVSRMAKIPPWTLQMFIRGEKRIDEFFAARLGEFFRTGKEYWLNLQDTYDKNGTL